MSETNSVVRKLDRAEHHLNDLKARIGAQPQHRTIRTVLEADENGSRYVYRLDLPEPPAGAAIIAGDFLFNVRSALDHLAVGLVPPRRRYKTSFPVITRDIWRSDSATDGELEDMKSWWDRATTDMNPRAIAVLKSLQPFHDRIPPDDDHALVALNAFQNADKHRELVAFMVGVEVGSLTVDGITTPLAEGAKNGAAVYTSETEVDVQLDATPIVGFTIGAKRPYRPFPFAFEQILGCAREATDRLLPLSVRITE